MIPSGFIKLTTENNREQPFLVRISTINLIGGWKSDVRPVKSYVNITTGGEGFTVYVEETVEQICDRINAAK